MTVSTTPATVIASYEGRKPPAPDWFEDALAHKPTRHSLDRDAGKIEYFSWGNPGAPGLFLLHGGGAHALWWAHIAPFFADDYHVVAMSMAGMGGSDWRPRYAIREHAQDMKAVAEAAGLMEAGKPVVCGHSFGGAPTATAAADPDAWVGQAIIMDSSLQMRHSPGNMERPLRERRFFGSLEEGLARFRFLPPQSCENHYIADMIARGAIVELEPGRFSWCFDPNGFSLTDRLTSTEKARSANCPLAMVYGDRSTIMDADALTHLRETMPEGTPFVALPDCGHHVMVDQPLALIAAMRGLMAR